MCDVCNLLFAVLALTVHARGVCAYAGATQDEAVRALQMSKATHLTQNETEMVRMVCVVAVAVCVSIHGTIWEEGLLCERGRGGGGAHVPCIDI